MAIQEIAGAYEIQGDDGSGAYSIEGSPSLGHSLPRPMLKKDKLDQGRRIPLGLGFWADGPVVGVAANGANGPNIPANSPLAANVRPQVLFRLERLLVPSDIAGNFVIEDVLIGTQSIFASSNAVPARVFDETATNVLLGTATNQPATNLTIKVINMTTLSSPFSAALVGLAVI